MINDRDPKTDRIKAFVLLDEDLDRDVGFKSTIKNDVYVTRSKPPDHRRLLDKISGSEGKPLYATYH